jgi:hypothetical protein
MNCIDNLGCEERRIGTLAWVWNSYRRVSNTFRGITREKDSAEGSGEN